MRFEIAIVAYISITPKIYAKFNFTKCVSDLNPGEGGISKCLSSVYACVYKYFMRVEC